MLRALRENGILPEGNVVVSNTPFDTTKGWIEAVGCSAISCTPMAVPDSYANRNTPFLGNIPMDSLKENCEKHGAKANIILVTVTNNGNGGQPVSMENMREISEYAKANGKLVWIDACRIFENAMFIKTYESGYQDKSLVDIVKEMLSYSDMATVSFKKMYSRLGGAILLNEDTLGGALEMVRGSIRMATTTGYGNGYDSYCGLTGTGMIEIISGILTAMDPEVIGMRISQVNSAYKTLRQFDFPVVGGGHGLYTAADLVLPGISNCHCAAEDLAGIRLCRAGGQDLRAGKVCL